MRPERRQGRRLRQGLTTHSFDVVAPAGDALPTVQTVALASPGEAWAVGERLERLGILTSYRSGYLRARLAPALHNGRPDRRPR